jgi:hypothetical protein
VNGAFSTRLNWTCSHKLASLNDGSRDGQLAVGAPDLKTAQLADAIAPTLQAALDDWAFMAPAERAVPATERPSRPAQL